MCARSKAVPVTPELVPEVVPEVVEAAPTQAPEAAVVDVPVDTPVDTPVGASAEEPKSDSSFEVRPTVQAPLPGAQPWGAPEPEAPLPAPKQALYVDADGIQIRVIIAQENKDGTCDILIPMSVGSYRRDRVSYQQGESHKGDYLVNP